MLFRWAVASRVATLVGSGVLAALAFAQGTPGWDIVGAVLSAFAIVDALVLVVVTWFQWRHRED